MKSAAKGKPRPVYHRVRMAGIAVCGASGRDGARMVAIYRLVGCLRCLAIIDERRAAARARAQKAGA